MVPKFDIQGNSVYKNRPTHVINPTRKRYRPIPMRPDCNDERCCWRRIAAVFQSCGIYGSFQGAIVAKRLKTADLGISSNGERPKSSLSKCLTGINGFCMKSAGVVCRADVLRLFAEGRAAAKPCLGWNFPICGAQEFDETGGACGI